MNLDEMDRDRLKAFARDNDLEKLVDLRAKTDTLREEIATAMELVSDESQPVPAPEVAPEPEMAPEPEPVPEPAPEPAADDDEREVVCYEVERLSRWFQNGTGHTLHAGSVVTEHTHPLDELRAQGVPLKARSERPVHRPVLGKRFS